MQTGACTAAPATMIITRRVARWALLLKREALGRTYGAQKRSVQAPNGATAMLPRSGRVDDNIDTVATDLHRTSSCVTLALPLPFPYYYYYYYPRAGVAASLLIKSVHRTFTDDHEADRMLSFARNDDVPHVVSTCIDLAASTEPNTREQQDVLGHGVQEAEEYVARPIEQGVIIRMPVNVVCNRQKARARFSA